MSQLKSNKSKLDEAFSQMKRWIYDAINTSIFGVYEAVVETYDATNAIASVRVIDLHDMHIDNCRVVYPGYGVRPCLISGMHVILMFRAFNLGNPVIIGHIPAETNPIGFTENAIIIENGTIRLNGNTITANGEDLTDDDIGGL